MSQKKVDEYKELKKNRRELVAKEKKEKAIKRVIGWVIAALVVCGLLAGIVITIVNAVNANKKAEESYYLTENALLDYVEMASKEEAAAAEAETAEAAEPAEEAETEPAEEAETEPAEEAETEPAEEAETESAEETEPAAEDTEAETEEETDEE